MIPSTTEDCETGSRPLSSSSASSGTVPFLILSVDEEADVLRCSERSGRVARMVGFDREGQTRIATAVTGLARRLGTVRSGRTTVSYSLGRLRGRDALEVLVEDEVNGHVPSEGEVSLASSSGNVVDTATTARVLLRLALPVQLGESLEEASTILCEALDAGPRH